MALHLITGYAGTEHITSADQGAYNMATFAEGEFVFDRGNKFAATVVSNNVVSIADGEAMMQGRFIKMIAGTSEDVTIENGTQGMKRNDLICIRYEKNASTGVETASFVVKKGTETSSTPTDPEYTTGDITDGQDLVNEMPMYRCTLNGLNLSITTLFTIKTAEYAVDREPIELSSIGYWTKANDHYTISTASNNPYKLSSLGQVGLTDSRSVSGYLMSSSVYNINKWNEIKNNYNSIIVVLYLKGPSISTYSASFVLGEVSIKNIIRLIKLSEEIPVGKETKIFWFPFFQYFITDSVYIHGCAGITYYNNQPSLDCKMYISNNSAFTNTDYYGIMLYAI